MSQRYVGIDFGTSTTLVAFRDSDQEPRVIPIGHNTSWMPSVIGHNGATLVVGEEALQLGDHQQLRSVKSLLISGDKTVTIGGFDVDVRDGVRALVNEAIRRSKEQVPGLFDDAEVFAGCPALWTGTERRLLVDVLHECGLALDIGELIDEPIAAGLQWVHDEWRNSGQQLSGRTVIFDAGGGTLDIAYLEAGGSDQLAMTVLSAEGIGESGDALDKTISADLLASEPTGSTNLIAETLTGDAARFLKEALSSQDVARYTTPEPFVRKFELQRAHLERLFEPQLNRAIGLTKATVRGSLLRFAQPMGMSEIRQTPWDELSSDVDHVALTGGLSNIPAIKNALESTFPTSTIHLVTSPQESVVKGLTYGAEITELNLPRPPINFFVSFPSIAHDIPASWLDEHRQIYVAFTPLYSPDEIHRRNFRLGFEVSIPSPPNIRHNYEVVLQCVLPTRSQETLRMRVEDSSTSRVGYGIRLVHNGYKDITFKLYTNGEFVFRTSNGQAVAQVERWPTLRGPQHDYQREIKMQRVGNSAFAVDPWDYMHK